MFNVFNSLLRFVVNKFEHTFPFHGHLFTSWVWAFVATAMLCCTPFWLVSLITYVSKRFFPLAVPPRVSLIAPILLLCLSELDTVSS